MTHGGGAGSLVISGGDIGSTQWGNPVDLIVSLLAFVGLMGFVAVTTVWALAMQRKGLRRQSEAMVVVDESIVLARQSNEMLARLIDLAEASAEQQAEVVRLLGKLVTRSHGAGGGF